MSSIQADRARQTRRLTAISACLAAARWRVLRKLVAEAASAGIAPLKIYEVILQAYLFLGYPKALEGLKIFSEFFANGGRPRSGKHLFNNWPLWKKRGILLCQKVYGRNFDNLMDRVGELSPELLEWMIVEGYGKVLARGRLPGATRELCTVAALVVTSDLNQLHSHLRGARNMGAGKTQIKETILNAGRFCPQARVKRALKLYSKIFEQ